MHFRTSFRRLTYQIQLKVIVQVFKTRMAPVVAIHNPWVLQWLCLRILHEAQHSI